MQPQKTDLNSTTKNIRTRKFYRDSGILKEDVIHLSYQEIIDLVVNTGSIYFENPTINLLKKNDNPILTYSIIERLKSYVEDRDKWEINIEKTEEKARERIKNHAKLLLTFFPKYIMYPKFRTTF